MKSSIKYQLWHLFECNDLFIDKTEYFCWIIEFMVLIDNKISKEELTVGQQDYNTSLKLE